MFQFSRRLAPPKRLYSRYFIYLGALFLSLWALYDLASHRNISPVPVELGSHIWAERASLVRESFQHAYRGYEQHAAPHDELRPLSKQAIDNFNGWAVTAIDSLDTMVLMGLDEEFKRGILLVESINFTKSANTHAPFFETVIRYLGGLLSAYALSNEPILLSKASELAHTLDPAFHTISGFPAYSVNLKIGQGSRQSSGVLAEIASFQLEYVYLAKLTGNKTYFNRAHNVMQNFVDADLRKTGGMLPIRWNMTSGQPFSGPGSGGLSVGAQADSAHEYLLKYYLLTGRTDKVCLEMYIRATTHILTNLLYLSPTRHLLYVTTTTGIHNEPSHYFEHLACFLPGLLALGAHTLPLDDLPALGIDLVNLSSGMDEDSVKGYQTLSKYNLRQLHLWAADGLAQMCYLTYADQPSGLGPDELYMQGTAGGNWINAVEKWKKSGGRGIPPGVGVKPPVPSSGDQEGVHRMPTENNLRDYTFKRNDYLLRPETVESLYILWRTTRDQRWREYGWEIYQALEKQSKTPFGYANLKSLDKSPAVQRDAMPSYFMAETLKYLYLLFTNEDLLPLDKWVFNTEAHPLPIFELEWKRGD